MRLSRAFGTSSQYGQSLGTQTTHVRLIDGALYVDPEKGKYKLFSWEDVAGLSPYERYDRGDEPTADDAPEVESKTYGTVKKTYELVAARVEPIEDDGEVLVPASSKTREVTITDDGVDFGDWEDAGGNVIDIGDGLTWWDGNEEYGPSTSSKRVAQLVTEYGDEVLEDEDDVHNWLVDDSGQDILRDDLRGRDIEFFITKRENESGRSYHFPVILDSETGAEISPNNTGGGSGNEDTQSESSGQSESEAVAAARELDSGSYPEPIADFIQSGEALSMTEERAESLLEELIDEPDNPMTDEMVDDYGGKAALVDRVTEA